MKTLIAYSSKYGATKECAERMQKRLPGETTLLDLDTRYDIALAQFDHIVIGSSIYMGKPRKAIKKFCERSMDVLLSRRLGLFLCCIQDLDKQVAQQMQVTYPKPLIDHAVVLGNSIGGRMDYSMVRGMDKFLMNIIAGDLRKKTGSDIISTISDERINRFCDLLISAPDKL